VIDKTLYTHPESNHVLSGITRKNILRIAQEAGISVKEDAVPENRIRFISEAFISNTSAEVTPVIDLGGNTVGKGIPGPLTRQISELFDKEIAALRG
jgi:D-alanine transaminase